MRARQTRRKPASLWEFRAKQGKMKLWEEHRVGKKPGRSRCIELQNWEERRSPRVAPGFLPPYEDVDRYGRVVGSIEVGGADLEALLVGGGRACLTTAMRRTRQSCVVSSNRLTTPAAAYGRRSNRRPRGGGGEESSLLDGPTGRLGVHSRWPIGTGWTSRRSGGPKRFSSGTSPATRTASMVTGTGWCARACREGNV